jgi:predicted phage tail protein
MPNEMQEILRNQPKPNDRASSKPATETRGGKITTYYTDRLASIAIGIAFLIAIAAGALLRFGFEVDMLSTLGATLVVWSVATLVLVFAKGSVFYFSMHH